MRRVKLRAFLTRLIWLGMLPVLALAACLALAYVRAIEEDVRQEAAQRVRIAASLIDSHLDAQVSALTALAASPFLREPPQLGRFHEEATRFRAGFDTHLILADASKRMLASTRRPYGTELPSLPKPRADGYSSANAALETGMPAIGDIIDGPLAAQPLVTVAFPVMHEGGARYLLLATIETRHFHDHLDKAALPEGWALSVLDGKGELIARSGQASPSGRQAASDDVATYAAPISRGRWKVVLEISPEAARVPLFTAAKALVAALLAVIAAGFAVGRLSSRQLEQAVESLAHPEHRPSPEPMIIEEVEEARGVIAASAQALRASEERWKFALEGAGDGVWDWNVPEGKVYFSRRWKEMLGHAEDEIGDGLEEWSSRVHPDDMPGVMRDLQPHLDGKVPAYVNEHRARCKDGSWKWILDRGMVISRAPDGRPVRVIGTHTDITDRKLAERALQDSERRFSTMFHASPIAITISSLKDGRILEANAGILRIWGLTREEALGRTAAELGIYADPADFPRIRNALEESGEVDGFDMKIRHRSGSVSTLSLAIRVVTIGGEQCLIAMATDISERVRLEESRLRSQNLESLGTLAGGIAHDFNNILSAIRGNADLAAEEIGASHPAVECIAEVQKAGARASELVRRITAFAKPKESFRKAVAMNAVVTEVMKLLRPTLPATIELRTRCGDEVPIVLADESQVHEALVNLTTNAAYAIGRNPGFIEYALALDHPSREEAARLDLPDGRYVTLSVRDSGCGMEPAIQGRIFDAFFTTKPSGEGTGLGLSMVYGTMRSHGGAVAVDSAPGQGSTFVLYFPVAGTPAEPRKATAPAAGPAAQPPCRLLYVDDEASLVRLAERALGRRGYSVSGFSNPEAALAAFAARPHDFDAVVTDLSMPQLPGVELARRLLAIRPGVPVILVTGYLQDADVAAAREIGITRVVLKASTLADLEVALDEALRHDVDGLRGA